MKSVSLILPATDETYSLQETVAQAHKLLGQRPLEFLIVTSPKLTTPTCRKTIEDLYQTSPNSVVSFDQTLPGIGGAIREAFIRATGEYVVLMASDLETDPSVLPELIGHLDTGADIAVTSRWKGGTHFAGYNPVKLILNFFFQLSLRCLYLTALTDLTYAYRAYKTDTVKRIRWEETRFPFFLESILKPLRLQYRIKEIAAPWKARTEGISHATHAQVWAYVLTALRIRFMKTADMIHSP